MDLNLQQRTCIKFCVKNGFNGARTLEMLEKCFGNDSLKKTVVYQWHERFKSGRESIEDDEVKKEGNAHGFHGLQRCSAS